MECLCVRSHVQAAINNSIKWQALNEPSLYELINILRGPSLDQARFFLPQRKMDFLRARRPAIFCTLCATASSRNTVNKIFIADKASEE